MGRANFSQRFSAGKSGTGDTSPGGTAEFSRTNFSKLLKDWPLHLILGGAAVYRCDSWPI
jgi:hypothetical protein